MPVRRHPDGRFRPGPTAEMPSQALSMSPDEASPAEVTAEAVTAEWAAMGIPDPASIYTASDVWEDGLAKGRYDGQVAAAVPWDPAGDDPAEVEDDLQRCALILARLSGRTTKVMWGPAPYGAVYADGYLVSYDADDGDSDGAYVVFTDDPTAGLPDGMLRRCGMSDTDPEPGIDWTKLFLIRPPGAHVAAEP